MHGKGLEKMLHEIGGELADGGGAPGGLEDRVRPSADVQGHKAQCLVHRYVGMADAVDPLTVAQCLVKRLAQYNGGVFNGMVTVNVQVAGGFDGEIKEAMNGNGREHMVQKPNTRTNFILPCSIEIQGNANPRFCGLPFNRCCPHCQSPSMQNRISEKLTGHIHNALRLLPGAGIDLMTAFGVLTLLDHLLYQKC